MHIIYPQDYFNPVQPDELFLDEAAQFKIKGGTVAVYNGREIKQKGCYLYRGWMMSVDEYKIFEDFMHQQGCTLITSSNQYRNAHHMPQWLEMVSDITPRTLVCSLDSLDETLSKAPFERFFVKDYVKSLTTTRGSIAENLLEVKEIVSSLASKRSIEGGICLREVMNFDTASEVRYFCYKREVLSPGNLFSPLALEVARRIDLPFFSIDIIKDDKGKEWLVEIGDGQVSDLKSPWTPERFVGQLLDIDTNAML